MNTGSLHNLHLAYGKGYLDLNLETNLPVDMIVPEDVQSASNALAVVSQALENPVDGLSLDSFKNAKRVAIAINDKTRPVPHQHLLPPLLDKLHQMGIPDQAITLIIATGTHKPMPPDEFELVLPKEIIQEYRVISHDCDAEDNLEFLGTTASGTPVYVNKIFLQADLKIVVGNIEPHHFMGFSGGAKSMSIGLTGRKTINKNHAMLTHPKAVLGEYDHNPMRQDVEEIGQMAGLQFALNAFLNNQKEIVTAFSGSPVAVMQAGIKSVRQYGQVEINQLYDVAIASVGGYPKDINLYQAQKAITHASLCVRDGGAIILAAECCEGSGSQAFEDFVQDTHTIEDVFNRFSQQGFRVGPHKAFQIATLASRVKIYMVSKIAPSRVQKWFITPAANLFEAYQMAIKDIQPLERIVVLPRATNTIPYLKK